MGSLVADDDGFTSASFHRFIVQGLRPYLSCGMAFNFPSKDTGGSKSNIDAADEDGISYETISFQAGVDLIQLLAMAICPNPPNEAEADKGARGDFDDVRRLANSTVPFSFTLSYSDRLQLVRLCTDLVIPEREYGTLHGSTDIGDGNAAKFGAVLRQLRTALFGFASYMAHSEKDAEISYKALANVAVNEGNLPLQAEFQRLVQATIDSRSEYVATAIAGCLRFLVINYNGSR